MAPSLTQHAPDPHQISSVERLLRLGEYAPEQITDGMIWLSGYAPDVFDAVLDAIDPPALDAGSDPAPYCATCGADIGIFLKFGLDWRHYRGTILGQAELFDPGRRARPDQEQRGGERAHPAGRSFPITTGPPYPAAPVRAGRRRPGETRDRSGGRILTSVACAGRSEGDANS